MDPQPFRIGEHVTGSHFTDRQSEVRRVVEAMGAPSRLLLYGERRQGKSSIMRQAERRASRNGVLVAWNDVATAAGLEEVSQRLLASLPFEWRWREELQQRLVRAQFRVEAKVDALGRPALALVPALRPLGDVEARTQLEGIVHTLDRIAEERAQKIAIVLDEFQAIERLSPRGGWILRDLMQTTHHLSWICAGSELSLIENLIGEDGPFYRFFESIAVGPIDAGHLASWIEARLSGAGLQVEPGMGAEIIRLAGPRTQDCLQLARAVFSEAGMHGNAGAREVMAALRRTVLADGDRFQTLWENVADSHRRVLRAIAAGESQLTATHVRDRYGLPTSGAVTKAIRVLRERRYLRSREPHAIDDPFFREWILLRAMPDGRPQTALTPADAPDRKPS